MIKVQMMHMYFLFSSVETVTMSAIENRTSTKTSVETKTQNQDLPQIPLNKSMKYLDFATFQQQATTINLKINQVMIDTKKKAARKIETHSKGDS